MTTRLIAAVLFAAILAVSAERVAAFCPWVCPEEDGDGPHGGGNPCDPWYLCVPWDVMWDLPW